jgi:hypothetical protein
MIAFNYVLETNARVKVAVTQYVAQLRHFIVGVWGKYPIGQFDRQLLLRK